MTRIEKHFRTQHLAERIRQLQTELIVLQDHVPNSRLIVAGVHLAKAAEELEHIVVLDLETQLRLSIEQVQEEKKRDAQVRGILPFEPLL